MDWVNRDWDVEAGESLVSAEVEHAAEKETLLPPGLPVATVTSVEPDPMQPLFSRVTATPRVNLHRLESVQVLVPRQESASD